MADNSEKNEITLHGIPASEGIACGQVFLFARNLVEVPLYRIEPDNRSQEEARFERALVQARQQISRIQAQVAHTIGAEEARIFDAHLMVLEDQALIGETLREFETTGLNIAACFNRVSTRYIKAFGEIDDEYLRERASDLRDVAQRVLQNLLGKADTSLSKLAGERILVASDISPSDAAALDRSTALAVVTDSGSKTSHAVIVARSMKVPAIVGMHDLTRRVRNGDWAVIDGYAGLVILHPSEETLAHYKKVQAQKKTLEAQLLTANREPALTADGVPVCLLANIERADEVALVTDYNAAGVGLYRSEYLYLDVGRIPTEEEQTLAFTRVAEGLAPHPVTIRTLDLGGDKLLDGGGGGLQFFASEKGKEENPFLGFRAIRLCLEYPEMFKDQLRAILRASVHGNVRLMYPMISGTEELDRANALLDECKAELRAAGVPFDEEIPVGAMIEIPSAATTADILAKKCAFFSIGTNDLIQYLLAIDRVNDRIAHLYEPTHPAVLRTIQRVIDAAHAEQRTVSLCGEVGGDPVLAPLLIGLGIDSISMTPPLIPAVRYLVRNLTMQKARELAAQALALADPKAIHALCLAFYREHMRQGGCEVW